MFCERAYYDLAHQVGGMTQAWAFGDCDEDGHGSFRDLSRWVREPVAHYGLGDNQMGGPRIHRELGSDVWYGLQAWWPMDKGSEVEGDELYTLANAASIGNEADATTGWTNVGWDTFESSAAQKYSGSYSMHFVAGDDGDRAHTSISATSGTRYRLSIYYYGVNFDADTYIRFNIGNTINGSQYAQGDGKVDEAWTQYTVDFTASAADLYVSVVERTTGNDADVYIDALSIKELTHADVGPEAEEILATELYTDANAAGIPNEADATTGWTNSGFDTFESSSAQAYNGTYSMHFDADSADDYASTDITVVSGTSYEVEFWYYGVNLTGSRKMNVQLGTAADDDTYYTLEHDVNGAWTRVQVLVAASNTTLTLTVKEFGASNNSEFYIDAVSVKAVETGYNMTGGGDYTTDHDGIANTAQDFDGSALYGNIDAVLPQIASDTQGTISLWVKPDDGQPAANETLLSLGDTDAAEFLQLQIPTSGKFRAALKDGGTLQWLLEANVATFADGAGSWTHLCVTQDGVSPILYVNGSSIAASFDTDTDRTKYLTDLAGADNARVGCLNENSNGNTNHFAGPISDVRIYNRPLSGAEVARLATYHPAHSINAVSYTTNKDGIANQASVFNGSSDYLPATGC